MYMFRIDHRTYDQTSDGRPLTLTDALHAVYGTGSMYGPRGVAVLRLDGTEVVTNAGSSNAITYAPTGRTITRQPARHLRYSSSYRSGDDHNRCSGWVTGASSSRLCQCHKCGCTRPRTDHRVLV